MYWDGTSYHVMGYGPSYHVLGWNFLSCIRMEPLIMY